MIWGGADARAGERLQILIVIGREVQLHRDHNKSTACRLISKPYQWVASDNEAASGGRLIAASEFINFNCTAAPGGRLYVSIWHLL